MLDEHKNGQGIHENKFNITNLEEIQTTTKLGLVLRPIVPVPQEQRQGDFELRCQPYTTQRVKGQLGYTMDLKEVYQQKNR